MQTVAVLLKEPERIGLRRLDLVAPGPADLVVEVLFSGISTGTEKLLFTGRMPPFPGMGYPLVPGYESVGRVAQAGPEAGHAVGDFVFVPGSAGFAPLDGTPVRGLFGGAASRLVVPGRRALAVPESLGEQAVLLALAATAQHAIAASLAAGATPDLVVGHGVLGRLIARLALAAGHAAPTVWETNEIRRAGAAGYAVCDPAGDARRDYRAIVDVSGDERIFDALVARLARGGAITLAGFYERVSFAFPAAFMREARFVIAAEFTPADLDAVRALLAEGRLSLDGLITHRARPEDAEAAYRTAFGDPHCLKMILDWRGTA